MNSKEKYKNTSIIEVTVRNDFLGLCDKKNYNMSDFEQLRSCDRLNLRIKFWDY
jgi:hypothetical protein